MPKIAGHAKSSVMALEIAVKLLIISAISCGSAIADAEKEGTKELCVGLQGPIYKSIEWLDRMGMDIIEKVREQKPFAIFSCMTSCGNFFTLCRGKHQTSMHI